MNKQTSFILFLSIFLLGCGNAKSENPTQAAKKRYSIKQGYVEYNISGKLFSGNEKLYFDNYGLREAKYTQQLVKAMGMTQKNHTATFVDYRGDAVIYTYDFQTKSGTRTENPMKHVMQENDPQELGRNMMMQMGGKKTGTGTVLGKSCEIWEIKNMGTRIWLWNWVPLKTVTNMMGMQMTIEATKISMDFDKKKLIKPQAEYRDVSNALKDFKRLGTLRKK